MHLVQLLDFVFVPFKAVLMQFFKLWISHQALVFGARTGYVALDCYVFEIRPIHTNPVIQPDGAIDVQGAASFRQAARENPALSGRLVTVFITVTPEQMRARMLGRGDSDEAEIARRLQSAEAELARAGEFDHIIPSADKESDYQRLLMLYRRLTSPPTVR